MSYPSVFHLVSEVSKKTGVLYILIGGFAVNYYKVTRQTMDVDFLIVKEDYEKIKSLLEDEGFKEDFTQKVFARLTSNKPNLMDIDFMFVDKETFDKIVKAGKKIVIAGKEFIIPSLNNLIALKLHALKYNFKIRQNKDLPDIINLIRINKLYFQGKEFEELCLKYGTRAIYREILRRM